MNKRYIIPIVLVVVLMSFAMASADGYGCYNQYCYPNYNYNYYSTPYYYSQPVVRECASFIADVTVADGSFIAPGNTFTKTWRIRNCGTTTWTTNYKLTFVSGQQMAAVSSVNLPYNVQPGATVDISVQMTSPKEAGSYKSSWMLMNESGSQFGVGANCQTPVWAQIINYVQTYNYNYNYGYNYGYGYGYNYCNPQPPCWNYWYCRVPGFDRDADGNYKPPRYW
ncbi:MAG: hypothetical protein IKP86_11640 [Anaerolineaceae bacterium]|nr:hypothetical protein [Anaerolineaceae bacterium]